MTSPNDHHLGGVMNLDADAAVTRGAAAAAEGVLTLTAEAEVIPGDPTDDEEDR